MAARLDLLGDREGDRPPRLPVRDTTGTPPTGNVVELDSRTAAAGTFRVEHPAASGTFTTWPQAGLAIAPYGARKVRVYTPEAGATRHGALKVGAAS